MAIKSAARPGRERRLLAGIVVAAFLVVASICLGTTGRAADRPGPGQRPASPSPTDQLPLPSPTATACDPQVQDCPSPSPSIYVVSPVPANTSPSPTVQPYLIGTIPTPSPTPVSGDTFSSPVPLGGGFEDQLPSPSAAASTGPTSSLAPHQSGVPLPFLAVGVVLIMAAGGSLIYAFAPRARSPFQQTRTAPTSPVLFTPYGTERGPTNLLSGGQRPPRPGGSS